MMRLERDECGDWQLCLGTLPGAEYESFAHLINEWRPLFTRSCWNWITFRFIQLSIEDTRHLGSYELEVVVLGIGLRIVVWGKATDNMKEISRIADDIKSGKVETVPLHGNGVN